MRVSCVRIDSVTSRLTCRTVAFACALIVACWGLCVPISMTGSVSGLLATCRYSFRLLYSTARNFIRNVMTRVIEFIISSSYKTNTNELRIKTPQKC